MATEEETIKAVAALVGQTSAQLNQLNENIVDGSSNLNSDAWNPEAALKSYVHNVHGQPSVPQQQSVPPQAQELSPEVFAPQQVLPPAGNQRFEEATFKIYDEILSRLTVIEQKLDSLTALDSNISKCVERGLNNKMKQITIKLDDSKHTK